MWSRLTRCETPWSPISRSRILMCLPFSANRSEEHTSELQSQSNLVCRLLLEKKKQHRFEVHPPTTRQLSSERRAASATRDEHFAVTPVEFQQVIHPPPVAPTFVRHAATGLPP